MIISLKYEVIYDRGNGTVSSYCLMPMDYDLAEQMLVKFKQLYLNDDGTGKAYPNGKGFYPFSNPRIVIASQYVN